LLLLSLGVLDLLLSFYERSSSCYFTRVGPHYLLLPLFLCIHIH